VHDNRHDGTTALLGSRESDFAQQKPSLDRASSLLTSWIQGFNRKSPDLGTSSVDHGKGQSHDRAWAMTQNDTRRDSASMLFSSSSSPSQNHSIGAGVDEAEHLNNFDINGPVLSRNLNQNLTHQSDFMEAHNPSGRLNRAEQFSSFDAAESFNSQSNLLQYPQSHNSGDQYDEVEGLRDFLSVSRTYDECVQFFLNSNSSSALCSKQNSSLMCLQSELDEARSQLYNISMELDLEKSNSKKIYENFHIAVWVSICILYFSCKHKTPAE
jgi:hypothetical protein